MTSQSIEDYQGWNLISIPLVLADFRKTVLYPSAQSKAFSYQAGYQTRDTLVNGVGYWLKFPSPGIVEFQGTSIPTESLTVNDNWNMIGCASYPVLARDIHAVPPTSIVSNIFGYSPSSGYVAAETLEAGRGYWIKVRNAGKLVLKSGTALSVPGSITRKSTSEARAEGKSSSDLSSLSVIDAAGTERVLYFSSSRIGFNLELFELPPPPPAGILDVRYSTNESLQIADHAIGTSITISSAVYPVRIRWHCRSNESAILRVDSKEVGLQHEGDFVMSEPPTTLSLELAASSGDVPREFALQQNYPNPFNPSSVIRYQLPGDVERSATSLYKVILKIYNVLGEVAATLVDENQNPGYKSIEWNAINVPSGVYFYRLEATGVAGWSRSFVQVKKLILLK